MVVFATRLLAATACLAAALGAGSASGEHVQYQIRRGELASRAANLGGWLLSECWMAFTSPLYANVPEKVGYAGEYAVMKHLGRQQGDRQFEAHWKTFITEEDVARIATTGLNTVRVSTGFWIINDEDTSDQSELTRAYPSGGLKYLDTLINDWGAKYNLAVMVSLHAHRGSQNGFDHSAPAEMGKTTWSDSAENVQSSLNYATFIAKRYKDSPAFLGLNLMNEPNRPTDYNVLKKYYKDAYARIRADGNDCIIVTSPWLENQGPPTMEDFMTCPDYYNVWHEWHIYYKWGWETVDKAGVFKAADSYAASHFAGWKGNPIFLGEWSLATIDEIELTRDELKNYSRLQMKEAEKAPAGWAFWAWRHDEETKKQPSGWSLRQLLKEGVVDIPTSVPVRQPTCGASSTRSTHSSSLGRTDSSTSGSSGSSSGSGSGGASQVLVVYENSTRESGSSDRGESSVVLPRPNVDQTPKIPASHAAKTASALGTALLAVVSAALAWTRL